MDLRNHGDATGAPPPHTLRACGEDLAALAAEVGRPRAVVGHSFGGKVALVYARDHGHPGLEDVWVLDATPGTRAAETAHEIEDVIAACRALPTPAPSREAVIEHFRARGFSPMLARWMTTNVRRAEGGGFVWRFDLDAIEEMLADYWREDLWPFLEAPPRGTTLHVLRAGRSDRWSEDDVRRLAGLGPRVETPVLEKAGHWVHVDDPAGLRALLDPTFA